jgi:hypothetical protein
VHNLPAFRGLQVSNPLKPDLRSTYITFSNYWTAALFFRARNGTFKRVPQKGNVGFEGQKGGMTVYYMQNGLGDYQQKSKVSAFKPVRSTLYFVEITGDLQTIGLSNVDRQPYGWLKGRSGQVPATYLHLPAGYEYALS